MKEDGKEALVFAPDSATAQEIAIEVEGVAITDDMTDAQKKATILESEGGILVCTDVNMPAFPCLYEDIFSYHPPTGYVSQTVRTNKLTYQGRHMQGRTQEFFSAGIHPRSKSSQTPKRGGSGGMCPPPRC
ncbi:MAG: hypothetical protein GY737_09395 [Desulfobacteraceae bacterium]|nr:hypothetical protein [Desulfobacteraceae bacterium]